MPKRVLQGTVVSDKTVRSTKKYKAHDETNAHEVGDQVFIQESAPISKDKRWVVLTAEQADKVQA